MSLLKRDSTRCTYLCWDDILQERYESRSLSLVWKIEIHTVPERFDTETSTMSSVLENKLFQVQECSFVRYTLSNLNQRPPRALSKFSLTFDALLIPDDEHDGEGLLQNRSLLYFLLDCQPNLESHTVRLRPNPSSINQSYFLSAAFGCF